MSAHRKDISGRRFGRVVANFSTGKNAKGELLWNCTCNCGRTFVTRGSALRTGQCTSCGCARYDFGFHGGTNTPEYQVCRGMWGRCYNANAECYRNYGGRGIRCCEGFRSFAHFLCVLGRRPTAKHTLERINNEGHYSCSECPECLRLCWPRNVRWATRKEQMRNTRKTTFVTVDGVMRPLAEWSDLTGVPRNTAKYRLKQGVHPFKPINARES